MLNHPSSTLIYALIFLIILLIVFIFYLPRLLRRKEDILPSRFEADFITDSFNMLGQEMKSLREQLIIKERLANLGELSAGIAHELRNPMAVIMGYSKLLLKSLDETDPRRGTVQSIIVEIDTMNGVMDELLKFSKSEAVNKTRVDLARMIDRAVRESIRPEAVHFVSAGGITVDCDETLFRQAIKNLLNNALEAGDNATVDIREGFQSGQKGVFVEITDNGCGISQEEIKKIFSPFYSTKKSGLGIGLSLVQKIALAHGTTAEVSSVEGKGSTFRLFLAC
jgi:two-component system, NtrC family, sensor kinase